MNKTLVIALALVAGASFCHVDAAKKKVVQEPVAPVVETFSLNTTSDSLSYAAGMTTTNGLIPYLLQQKVDTACMVDFVRGFRETVAKPVDDPKVKAYLVGVSIAQQVVGMVAKMSKEFEGTPDSIMPNLFYKGFADALLRDTTYFDSRSAETFFTGKLEADKAIREERLYGANRDAGRKFLEENAAKADVITLPSGLQYKVLTQGSGDLPTLSDKVQVNYEGRLIDGTVFDASAKHGNKPAEFRPTDVIKGWTEALTMMPVGSKWQVYIPFELAYGSRDAGEIKPYSALVFDIELVGIVGKEPANTKVPKSKKK